jgi:hypothetical protein
MSSEDQYADTVSALRAAGCVFAEDEARLLVEEGGDLEALVARRASGEPLEWVLGWAEFADRRIAVRPGVFVPRRRSELLAAQAIVRLRPASVAVELCCGAAPVAATILEEVPFVEVHATDVDPAAQVRRQRFEEVSLVDVAVRQVLPGAVDRRGIDVGRVHLDERHLLEDRRGDRTRSAAQLDRDPGGPQPCDRLGGEQLRALPRHEHPGPYDDPQVGELRPPEHPLQRLAGDPAGDERLEVAALLHEQPRLVLGVHAPGLPQGSDRLVVRGGHPRRVAGHIGARHQDSSERAAVP